MPTTDLGFRRGLHVTRARPLEMRDNHLVVVFRSLNDEMNKLEFLRAISTLDRPALFLTDTKKTMFTGPHIFADTLAVIREEMRDLGCDAVDALGFSKGGYAALCYAEHLPIRRVLSLSPRYTTRTDLVFDPRYRPVLDRLGPSQAFASIDRGIGRVESGAIVHGAYGFDVPHIKRFPRSNLQHWILARSGHFVTRTLRAKNVLDSVVCGVLENRPDDVARDMRRVHGLPRFGRRGRAQLVVGSIGTAAWRLATWQVNRARKEYGDGLPAQTANT